ncbi:MAG: phage terminase large subunit [Polyangiales bacterium]
MSVGATPGGEGGPDPFEALLGDPTASLRALDAVDAEGSLRDYVKVVWPVIEPGSQYIPGWPVDAICEHLEAVTAGQIKRLVINVPPGCMKSLLTEVLWPSWEWGPRNLPATRYVCSSYSDKLTIRDNLRARRIIQSEHYQELWGDRFALTKDQNAKLKFENDKTGFKLATSVGGLGTGERGNRFVIDDPHNVQEGESVKKRETALYWFANVVPTRIISGEESAIIVIMQRVHGQDVSGLILKEELGYEWLCLPMEYEERHRCFTSVPRADVIPERVTKLMRESEPIPRWVNEAELAEEAEQAPLPPDYEPKFKEMYPQDRREIEGDLLWPDRFSKHHLEEELKPQLRSWGGTYAEAGQLQQRPAPREGGMMQRADFQIIDTLPSRGRWVRGWDFASSTNANAKFSVGLKMGLCDGRIVIADVRRKRVTPGQLEDLIVSCCELDGLDCEQDMPQDPGQAGKYQKAGIAKLLHGHNFHFSPEIGSKPDRAKGFAAQVEGHNVYLLRAPWNDTFINEACLFPNGEFSDQIDAASRSYGRLLVRKPKRIGRAPMVVGATGG